MSRIRNKAPTIERAQQESTVITTGFRAAKRPQLVKMIANRDDDQEERQGHRTRLLVQQPARLARIRPDPGRLVGPHRRDPKTT
jgi:hypothetical protein